MNLITGTLVTCVLIHAALAMPADPCEGVMCPEFTCGGNQMETIAHGDCCPSGCQPIPANIANVKPFGPTRVRKYFLKIEEILHDYLPLKMSMFDDTVWQDIGLENGPDRIGSQYHKAVFNQYTDNTFKTMMPKPAYYGYVGPLLHIEVGEQVDVLVFNNASMNASCHPHNMFYNKKFEGAHYDDHTFGVDRKDDIVQPGEKYTFKWSVPAEFAPADGDPNCIPAAYHSHINPVREISTGLMGMLDVCKRGTLDDDGMRTDVDEELMFYVDSINESESALFDQNLALCGDETACRALHNAGDDDFEESLAKDSINGLMFGNGAVEVCAGDKIAAHVMGLEAELHPIGFMGQPFVLHKEMKSTVGIFPAAFKTVEFTPTKTGRWVIQCLNTEHNTNGMRMFLDVLDCDNGYVDTEELQGEVRTYYLKAEEMKWDYVPSDMNMFDNSHLISSNLGSDPDLYISQSYDGHSLIGKVYKKSVFKRYTDANFDTLVPRPARQSHMGFLGPELVAEAGDTLNIVLCNGLNQNVSIYLPGTKLNDTEIGLLYKDPDDFSQFLGKVVGPGETKTYTFEVPRSVAPTADQDPCISHMYSSIANFEMDVHSGLLGPLKVCRAGELDPTTGMQRNVDAEFYIFAALMDENLSSHIADNIDTYAPTADPEDETFIASNVMASINGRSFGNLAGLDMCRGDHVVWHTFSVGDTTGLHGITWNGNTQLVEGINRDTVLTFSGVNVVGDMAANNAGKWALWCHTTSHFRGGMSAVYHVDDSCGDNVVVPPADSGVTRTYYVKAVETMWDYIPTNTIHPLNLHDFSDPSSPQYNRINDNCPFLGSSYKKVLYREYTDDTFITEAARGDHLGILGPLISANVGDTIRVIFKNNASRPYSIWPQNLRYTKAHEGMTYRDGVTPIEPGDAVPPGGTHEYVWQVPESAGPGPNGPNCIGGLYHSAVDPVKDVYSGLIGYTEICKPNILDDNKERTDVTARSYEVLFMAFDENRSWYLDENIALRGCMGYDKDDETNQEFNRYDSINGLAYNNLQGLYAYQGEHVDWYACGLGDFEDVHTPHWHGQTLTYRKRYAFTLDVLEVVPATCEIASMLVTNIGTYLFHCHVGVHTADGMVGTWAALPPPKQLGPP